MRAFIVRPFGVKAGVDFDRVERELIVPALNDAGCPGGTTAEFLEAGNIRADMFEQLLKADLVVADISIHNANVFYELGIRHALRDKRTFLIRCSGDEVPFDLHTDRYLSYDAADPAAKRAELADGLRRTRDSTRADSPVFQLIPGLEPQDWARYLVVPEDFTEEVRLAARNRQVGDLEMLADETEGFDWQVEGLRRIGRELFGLKAWDSARTVWEQVARLNEDEREAARLLPTIYQRLGDLPRSELAVEWALTAPGLAPLAVAELYGLRGSNEKALWLREWQAAPVERRREVALASAHLKRALEAYETGFREDLSHHYSGMNALALLVVITELAAALPAVWDEGFDTEETARSELESLKQRRQKIATVVGFSVEQALARLRRQGKRDVWAETSLADLRCLTSTRPGAVARAYQEALTGAWDFSFDAVRRQLVMLNDLDILTDNVRAALEKLDALESQAGGKTAVAEPVSRVLVFTGHMIDAPGRAVPRFPPDKEGIARQAIKAAIAAERAKTTGRVLGIAGGACGGDILFHELCTEMDIETWLLLALPPERYTVSSVQDAGPQWVERFRALCERIKPRILADSKELPRWLRARKDYTLWERNNLWTLHNALAFGGSKVSLIALWNGDSGDGPGGTKDMVDKARARGAVVNILDTRQLFGL